ncbi:MAG TPA: hypothetical protein VFM80_06615 [Gracilimonas sp.]|uniref:hypothetical protein n=1 Tax=Gracilimonas sp. TaxID=1974203 RepID=UPI002DA86FB8|nr:hypothetical protein [Gracilimonas sp.]
MSTSKQGKLLTQNNVDYAEFTMAKNTAHSAIQLAMQEINQDDTFLTTHSESNPWTGSIEGRTFGLYIDALNNVAGNSYWQTDSIRIVSNATQYIQKGSGTDSITVEVVSLYLKESFSSLVPAFGGALQFPTGYGSLTADGNAHEINGAPPHCAAKPAIVTGNQDVYDDLKTKDANDELNIIGGDISYDSTLNYNPTDELIERLKSSGNAVIVDENYSGSLGTASNPGVFFINGHVTLTGQQSEGYGIMIIQDGAYIDYAQDGLLTNIVEIRGNFEFNGLVIFENAKLFEGKGTPTINGSVLVGQTNDSAPIDIKLSGNVAINYDCDGENYAKIAAADAVQQNKFSRVVTTESSNFTGI